MILKQVPENRRPYDRPNDDVGRVLAQADEDGSEIYVRQNSVRFNRRRFTVAVTSFVIGAALILMQSPAKTKFLSPGPLNSTHAQIIAAESGDQCSACHQNAKQGFGQWISGMFSPGKNVQACQSQLCMKCHSQTLDSQYATRPHNISDEAIQKITSKYASLAASAKTGFAAPVDAAGNIECSACHREHHGQSALTAMTDQQCQTCHSVTYDSFESDHPQFTSWPQQRRQKIAFDHASHGFKHFPSKNEKFECSQCHVDDHTQSVKLLASYEQTCAACHQKDIDGSSQQGAPLLVMPMLDLQAIADMKLSVGRWPDRAAGDFDGRLPELMQLMLFKDQNASEILARRGTDFEFGDLDPDEPVDVQDAVQLVWSIKYLIYDLATDGAEAMRERMEFAFGRSISETEFLTLTEGLDAGVFAKAANRWLPGLPGEVLDRRARAVGGQKVAELFDEDAAFLYFDEDPDVLVENPLSAFQDSDAGQLVEPQLESVEQNQNLRAEPELVLETAEPALPAAVEEERNWLTGELETPPSGSASPQQSKAGKKGVAGTPNDAEVVVAADKPQIPQSDLLTENPLANMVARPSQAEVKQPAVAAKTAELGAEPAKSDVVEPTVSGGGVALNLDQAADVVDEGLLARNPLSLKATEETNVQPPLQTAPVAKNSLDSGPASVANNANAVVEAVTPNDTDQTGELDLFDLNSDVDEQFVGSAQKSGWFRNDSLMQISYRPAGHADPFLAVMMEMVAGTSRVEDSAPASGYFRKMISDSSVGGCSSCHTVDSVGDRMQVNWKASYRNPLVRSFTKFSHGPHLTQVQLKDCSACHSLDATRTSADSFKHFDATVAVSNFAPIEKANCTSCHFKESSSNRCTQCHNYHVGSKMLLSN